MANTTRAYTNIKTIEDFKNDLLEYPQYVNSALFQKVTLLKSIQALNAMDEETSQKFLECLHHIDKKQSCPGSSNGNRFHKVPTILASAIYFAYYPTSIEGLNYDEIAILSKYSIPEAIEFYQTASTNWTKSLLGEITSKSDDHMALSGYMELASCQMDFGSTPEAVAKYFHETPPQTLRQEVHIFTEKQIEKGGIYL